MRERVVWLFLAMIPTAAKRAIVSKERVPNEDELMLLELAPRDPRLLLLGD